VRGYHGVSMRSHASSRSPVLALTILDGRSLDGGVLRPDSKVLAVVRRPETNPTHPNVVSVPTERIPQLVYDEIVAGSTVLGRDPVRQAVYFRADVVDSLVHNKHHPVIYATKSLMSYKLGLTEGLVSGRVRVRATLCAKVDGVAVYDNVGPENVYEPVSMLNVVVAITHGQDELPMCTSSYSLAAWSSVTAFLEAVAKKDPGLIGDDFDPLEFCVHGVCMTSAAVALTRLMGHAPIAERSCRELEDPRYASPR
jgi:hypothetical protein